MYSGNTRWGRRRTRALSGEEVRAPGPELYNPSPEGSYLNLLRDSPNRTTSHQKRGEAGNLGGMVAKSSLIPGTYYGGGLSDLHHTS